MSSTKFMIFFEKNLSISVNNQLCVTFSDNSLSTLLNCCPTRFMHRYTATRIEHSGICMPLDIMILARLFLITIVKQLIFLTQSQMHLNQSSSNFEEEIFAESIRLVFTGFIGLHVTNSGQNPRNDIIESHKNKKVVNTYNYSLLMVKDIAPTHIKYCIN